MTISGPMVHIEIRGMSGLALKPDSDFADSPQPEHGPSIQADTKE